MTQANIMTVIHRMGRAFIRLVLFWFLSCFCFTRFGLHENVAYKVCLPDFLHYLKYLEKIHVE